MTTILEHLERGTLVRGDWGDGTETACLYSALVPGATDTDGCPAEVMPQWLADVTPDLDDEISADGWKARMRRYGEASLRWHVITPEGWEAIRRNWTANNIELAINAARQMAERESYWPKVEAACAGMISTLRRGDDPSEDQRADAWAAEDAAVTAARSAAEAAAVTAARAAAKAAARAAVWAAARAAVWAAARAAARAAVWATEHATDVERDVERATAWDTIFDDLMTLIEAEIEKEADQ